jgi:hypothetical protein
MACLLFSHPNSFPKIPVRWKNQSTDPPGAIADDFRERLF